MNKILAGFGGGVTCHRSTPATAFPAAPNPFANPLTQARKANIERPTPNFQRRTEEKKRRTLSFRPLPVPFDVRVLFPCPLSPGPIKNPKSSIINQSLFNILHRTASRPILKKCAASCKYMIANPEKKATL
jgi:hypothetical protein